MTSILDRDPATAAADIVAAHRAQPEWLDEFADEFDRHRGAAELERLLRVWDLSRAEAGAVFGVSRQAFSKWLERGVPADRSDAVADTARATDLLVHHLKRDRIPAVVRRAAPNLDGRSLLELLAAGETSNLLEAVRAMFDFGDAHA